MPFDTINLAPREYQKQIFETAKNYNTLVVLPTGLGKTLVALLLSVDRLKNFPLSKILFLAPTKPLVEQHFNYFKKHLPELFASLEIFTGAVPAPKRKKFFQTAEIIFSTPQCIANDIKKELYSLNEVSLLIIDEAHRCLKNYDYTYVAKTYKSQSENPKVLGLTASPGSDPEKVRQICSHLDISKIESRTRDSEDVKPYIEKLEYEKVPVSFPPELMEIRLLLKKLWDNCIDKLKEKNVLHGPANKITLLKLQSQLSAQISRHNFSAMHFISTTAQAIKISHALELLETQTLLGLNNYMKSLFEQAKENKSRAVKNLIKTPEFNSAYVLLLALLAKNMEHPKVNVLNEIVKSQFDEDKNSKMIVFAQFRDTISLIASELNKIPNIKASVFIGQAKKRGQGLNQKEQKQIIENFKDGKINVLCSTSIGEEGLDIPEVSAVIFYEPIPSAIRKIQRAGRTARLSPGKLKILVTEGTRDEINHYASAARERKMYKTISQIQNEINNKPKTLDDFKSK